MITQYATAIGLLSLAGVAGAIGYSFSVDSRANLAQADMVRRLPIVADMIAAKAMVPAGQTEPFPPVGTERGGIYTVPAGLEDTSVAASGDTYLYCPLVPVQLSGTAISMPQPSGATVAGAVSANVIVNAPAAPAINPRPIAAIVAALPRQRLPDCTEITYGASAASAPGAVVKLVFANETARVDQLAYGKGAVIHVAPAGAGARDGTSPGNAMTLPEALNLWLARRPRYMQLQLAAATYADANIASLFAIASTQPDIEGQSTLSITSPVGVATITSGASSLTMFAPMSDLVVSGVTFDSNLGLQVRPGRTMKLGGGTFGPVYVSPNAKLSTFLRAGLTNNFVGNGTSAALGVDGQAFLTNSLLRPSSTPCLIVGKGGTTSGSLDCVRGSGSPAVRVSGMLALEVGGNHQASASAGAIAIDVIPGGVLDIGASSNLNVNTAAGGIGVRLTNASSVLRSAVLAGPNVAAVWEVGGQSEISFARTTAPAISRAVGAGGVAFRIGDKGRLTGSDSGTSAESVGGPCFAFTDPTAAGLWAAPKGGTFAVNAYEPVTDPTPADAMTSADIAANADLIERNRRRDRLQAQIPLTVQCS